MSETLTASVKLTVNASLVGTSDLGQRSYDLPYSKTISFSHGTGANQANQIWTDTRTLSASTAEDLDLYGVLTSPLGTTLNFTKIKASIVTTAAGNTNNVVIGGDSAALLGFVGDASDTIIVRPGGFIAIGCSDATAYGVTATTGDILQVANSSSGTSVTYTIIVIGVV